MVILVWAMTSDGVIGKDNQLPWNDREELSYFKKITLHQKILMGRKTFISLKSKPLPQRKTIIVTRDVNFHFQHVDVIIKHDLKAILTKYQRSNENLYVIGGAEVFKIAINYANRLYVSIMKGVFVGDTYFPEINWNQFQLKQKIMHPTFIAMIYERKQNDE